MSDPRQKSAVFLERDFMLWHYGRMGGERTPVRAMVLAIMVAALGFAGCSAEGPTGAPTRMPTESTSATPPAVAASASAITGGTATALGRIELQGDLHGGNLWAILYHRHVGTEVKTIWRMTGEGSDFTIKAVGGDGQILEPVWGPDLHAASSWHRPGEEWGAGWVIPTAGVWTFEATRGATTGTVSVEFS